MLDKLRAPFPSDGIHWRAQTVTQDGTKALALAYLDARDVMDRLDDVAGAENWRDAYAETPKGRIICTLEIRVAGEWIGKSDGAGDTDVEGDKGAISDALKRAAVKWGIGRYLYDLGNVWAPCESYEANGKKKWKKWKPEASRSFGDALRALATPKPQESREPEPKAETPTGPINDKTRDWLAMQITAHGKNITEFCKAHNIGSLKDVFYEDIAGHRKWLADNKGATA